MILDYGSSNSETLCVVVVGIFYHQYADDTQLYTVINPTSDSDLKRLSEYAEAVTVWLNSCH